MEVSIDSPQVQWFFQRIRVFFAAAGRRKSEGVQEEAAQGRITLQGSNLDGELTRIYGGKGLSFEATAKVAEGNDLPPPQDAPSLTPKM